MYVTVCNHDASLESWSTDRQLHCVEHYCGLRFLVITQHSAAKGSRIFLESDQLFSAHVHKTDAKKSLNLNKQQWLTGSLG